MSNLIFPSVSAGPLVEKMGVFVPLRKPLYSRSLTPHDFFTMVQLDKSVDNLTNLERYDTLFERANKLMGRSIQDRFQAMSRSRALLSGYRRSRWKNLFIIPAVGRTPARVRQVTVSFFFWTALDPNHG
jgi:hypothetical protein